MLVCCQMTNFSDWLSNEIAQRGISPAKLAVLMRKDAGVVSRILSGARHGLACYIVMRAVRSCAAITQGIRAIHMCGWVTILLR